MSAAIKEGRRPIERAVTKSATRFHGTVPIFVPGTQHRVLRQQRHDPDGALLRLQGGAVPIGGSVDRVPSLPVKVHQCPCQRAGLVMRGEALAQSGNLFPVEPSRWRHWILEEVQVFGFQNEAGRRHQGSDVRDHDCGVVRIGHRWAPRQQVIELPVRIGALEFGEDGRQLAVLLPGQEDIPAHGEREQHEAAREANNPAMAAPLAWCRRWSAPSRGLDRRRGGWSGDRRVGRRLCDVG